MSGKTTAQHTLGVILAGGAASRMDGRNKAELRLGGGRLIDRVQARLAPQVGSVVISGARNYGLPQIAVPDLDDGVKGPVAGIAAVARWAREHAPHANALLCVPVDSPFFPEDLHARLSASGGAAVASGDGRLQPAFGYWPVDTIAANAGMLARNDWLSLKAWADACGAGVVDFGNTGAFLNINTPADLAAAEALLTMSGMNE